jgi:hypothetical protein
MYSSNISRKRSVDKNKIRKQDKLTRKKVHSEYLTLAQEERERKAIQ